MSTALARMRQATRPLHDRTETALGADRILSGAITPAEFDSLLRCNYYLYDQTEPTLRTEVTRRAPELLPLLPELLPVLHRACAQRGIQTDPTAFSGWPAPVLPHSRPEIYGMSYVLLGSHLGGRVMYRALAQHPDLAATGGLDFYAALAATPSRNWKRFLELLGEQIQLSEHIATATTAAGAMFDFFYAVYRTGLRR